MRITAATNADTSPTEVAWSVKDCLTGLLMSSSIEFGGRALSVGGVVVVVIVLGVGVVVLRFGVVLGWRPPGRVL